MTGNSSVGGFSLHDAILVDADGGHETEGTEALSDNVGLYVTIVVFAGPHKTTVSLEDLSNQIVNQSVLVVDASSDVFVLEFGLVDILENLHEKAIVLLQDGVLRGEFKGVSAGERVSEARAGERSDRGVGVEHAEVAAAGFEVGDLLVDDLGAIVGRERDVDLAGLGHDVVLAPILVTEGVAANNDGLGPAGHEAGDVGDDDGLAEHGTVENVTDGAVGASPHLLEAELFNTALIGGDSGTLDTNFGAEHGIGTVNGDLVVGGITVLHAEIIVLSLEVDVRVDMLQKRG